MHCKELIEIYLLHILYHLNEGKKSTKKQTVYKSDSFILIGNTEYINDKKDLKRKSPKIIALLQKKK